MSSRTVIEAVMVEVRKDFPAVQLAIGRREAVAHGTPPRIEWVNLGGAHRGPQQSGHNPRPIANRWVQWAVRCWGADLDEAEALLSSVVRALHLTLTRGGYELGGEEGVETGLIGEGEAIVLTVSLGVPILDRAQPTQRATTLNTNGTIP